MNAPIRQLIPMTPMEPNKDGSTFNMGQPVGKDLYLVFGNHSHEPCEYLILANTKTGERAKILF